MRTTLLVAVSMLAIAFAGCTEEPPSGEFSSSGNALMLTGAVVSFESRDFSNPYAQSEDTLLECAQNDQEQAPEQIERCEYPYTVMTVNFTDLPDPNGKTYSIKFYADATGTQEDITALSVMEMDGSWQVHDWTFDNTDDCDGSKDNNVCNKANTFDSVQLYLDDVLVASAPLSSGAAFEFDDGLLGASFTATYNGKTITLTASGLGNHTYEGWLIKTDAEGVATHEDSFPGIVNGENVLTAAENVDRYSGFHIHVAGTKLNVAIATI